LFNGAHRATTHYLHSSLTGLRRPGWTQQPALELPLGLVPLLPGPHLLEEQLWILEHPILPNLGPVVESTDADGGEDQHRDYSNRSSFHDTIPSQVCVHNVLQTALRLPNDP